MTLSLPCLGMMRALRVRQTYNHRLRDAIAATGNADLFRNVAIPASTRRTWARGEVRPVVASVDVELSGLRPIGSRSTNYDSAKKTQPALMGLLARLLKLRGGNLDGDRVPDGAKR